MMLLKSHSIIYTHLFITYARHRLTEKAKTLCKKVLVLTATPMSRIFGVSQFINLDYVDSL